MLTQSCCTIRGTLHHMVHPLWSHSHSVVGQPQLRASAAGYVSGRGSGLRVG